MTSASVFDSSEGESRPPAPTRRRASDLDWARTDRVRSSELELESKAPSVSDPSPDEESGGEGGGGEPLGEPSCAAGMTDREDCAEGTNGFNFKTRGSAWMGARLAGRDPDRRCRRLDGGSGDPDLARRADNLDFSVEGEECDPTWAATPGVYPAGARVGWDDTIA